MSSAGDVGATGRSPLHATSYKEAGVDIDAGNRAVDLIKEKVRSTFGPQVLTGIGGFGSLYAFSGYREPVLVASADGVGTKLKVAFATDRHDTIGVDLVSHCVNDILTCGAMPLFFLDYIAMGKLEPEKVAQIVCGLAEGCRAAGCALVGGETAEMPGLYAPGEYDLAGFIVGAVERDLVVDGSRIQAGDLIWGLPSSGLHTNGYSLARKVLAGLPLDRHVPELGRTLAEELLEPHRCYLEPMKRLLADDVAAGFSLRVAAEDRRRLKPAATTTEEVQPSPRPSPGGRGGGQTSSPLGRGGSVDVRGMAHITGGGIPGNVSRVIPEGKRARFRWGSWPVPPIFSLIQERGGVAQEEMLRVFNMGLGYVFICPPEGEDRVRQLVPEALLVGEIVVSEDDVKVEVVNA